MKKKLNKISKSSVSTKKQKRNKGVAYTYLKDDYRMWVRKKAFEYGQTISAVIEKCIESVILEKPFQMEPKVHASLTKLQESHDRRMKKLVNA